MPYVLIERLEPVAIVTLNEPEKRNPLSPFLVRELTEAFQSLANDQEIRALVLTGAGPGFCAGADFRRLQVMSPLEDRAEYNHKLVLNRMIWNYPKPTIAAVNGSAMGAGCNLANWCDVTIAAESAKFGYPEVRLGAAAATVVVSLLRTVGRKKMFELVLSGKAITAFEAEKIGLVNKVVPDKQLLTEAVAMANMFASNSPSAVTFTKELIKSVAEMGYDEGLEYARDIRVLSLLGEGSKERLAAYQAGGRSSEKAKPQ